MNDTHWRIRLLVMESDLNRVRLNDELMKFRQDVQAVAHQATCITSLVGLGLNLLSTLAKPTATPARPAESPATWMRLLISASTALTSWWSSSRRP